jgi:predicted kinase
MELDERGEVTLSDLALSGFLSVFNDNDSKKLINFYKCYRALVRAKVNCFLLSEKGDKWQNFQKKCDETKGLVNLAYSYALCLEKPRVLIFYGLTGSGKSKNAEAFAKAFGCAYLNTDICRKEMFNMQASERHYVPFGSSIYSEDNTLRVYDYLGERSYKMELLGRLVVVDGTFLKKTYLDKFLDKRDMDVFKIKCEAPIDILRNRLEKRIHKKTISDGRLEILVEQTKISEDIGFDFLLNTENSIENHPLLVAKRLSLAYEK